MVRCLQTLAAEVSPHTESVAVPVLSPSVFDHLHSVWKRHKSMDMITLPYMD